MENTQVTALENLTNTLFEKFEEGVKEIKDCPITSEKFKITLENTMAAFQVAGKTANLVMSVHNAQQAVEQEDSESTEESEEVA